MNDDESTATYSNCLIANSGGSTAWDAGLGTDNGNNIDADPLFFSVADGNLRLLANSPAINTGDNSANNSSSDLAGNPRIQNGTIDLGAFEGPVTGAIFSSLYPGLSPDGDANGNGLTNFTDYALGADPTAPDDPTLRPKISKGQVTVSFRNNAADVFPGFQKSSSLLPGSWESMIEDVDYSVGSDLNNSGQTIRTIELLSPVTDEDRIFFRQIFTQTP